jgi:hypothetical protein
MVTFASAYLTQYLSEMQSTAQAILPSGTIAKQQAMWYT